MNRTNKQSSLDKIGLSEELVNQVENEYKALTKEQQNYVKYATYKFMMNPKHMFDSNIEIVLMHVAAITLPLGEAINAAVNPFSICYMIIGLMAGERDPMKVVFERVIKMAREKMMIESGKTAEEIDAMIKKTVE